MSRAEVDLAIDWAAGEGWNPGRHDADCFHGADPGGHKRDVALWTTKGGHYGHSHVPENVHWDPAYTTAEAAFVLAAKFDANGKLTNSTNPAVAAILNRAASLGAKSTVKPQKIDGHFDVGENP